jgi:hypothetical protein
MVTLQATRVPIDVDALAKAAKREPVTIMAGDKPVVVVVDPAEFERLSGLAHSAAGSEADPLIRAARATQRTAAAAGLSEQELERLLADES